MKLLEFITYCELAGLVTTHKKADRNWETDVPHFDIGIENGRYKAGIRYGILQEQGVIISFALHEYTISPWAGAGIRSYPQASLKQIVQAIVENEIT